MLQTQNPLTGREVSFLPEEIIVSKTDTRGVITYANDVFLRIAGYEESEVLGVPHNLIRHPDMPRCVFRLLWERLEAGREVFAYVVNRCVNGDHYWVLAHATPTFDGTGGITGYHSSRRVPSPEAVEKIRALYRSLREVEQAAGSGEAGVAAGTRALEAALEALGLDYDQFVFSLHTT